MNKRYFPLFVDLSERRILVVGGGRIAARRIRSLLPFAGEIRVASPVMEKEIEAFIKEGLVVPDRRTYRRDMLEGADLVLAATNDPACNEQIAVHCREKGIPVNVCHRKEGCDFYFPGIVIEGDVVAGVTAGGTDHRKAKQAREKIARALKEIEQEEQHGTED